MQNQKCLDILFVLPSYGNSEAVSRIRSTRIEKDISNQESPNIGMGYLLARANQLGINAKFIDMVYDSVTTEDLISFVEKHRPALVAFTACTIHIKAAGFLAEKIKAEY